MAITIPSAYSFVELVTTTQLPIKLSLSNYLTWYKQVTLLLTANNLLGYISGTLSCPPTTIGTSDTNVENPAFITWKRQDNYVLLALFGTCGPEVQIVMSSATSFDDAMSRLTKFYANQSRTIMSLKEHLSSITKGDSNVCDYLCSIRSITDDLTLIGHSIDDLDLVIVARNGFGHAYREVCASIRTRDTSLLFDELFDKLFDYEIFLQWEKRRQSSFPVITNHVSRSSFSHGQYKRSIPSPNGVSPARGNLYSSHPRNSSSRSPLICQYCDHCGHSAKTYYKLHGYPSNHSRRQANMVNKETSWLLDSGASHHVTRDLVNLTLAYDYTGNDKLVVANGKRLTITHSGSTSISTSSSLLHLNNVLYVPNISQNLLSVSQLCQSNFVYIEFFPRHFQVKDLSTGAILLCGKNENNVYKISCLPSHPQSHHIHCHTSLSTWNSRLGHPASRILHHALKANVIPFYSSLVQCSNYLANKSTNCLLLDPLCLAVKP